MERKYSRTTKRLNRFQPTLNNNALYRRLDLIHVSYEPPLFNPSLQPSPPSSLSFLPFHERISFEKRESARATRHATCQRDSSQACVSPPSFDVSKNREMSVPRDERKVMENTGRPCSCRCCPMELQISVPAPSYEFICRLCAR